MVQNFVASLSTKGAFVRRKWGTSEEKNSSSLLAAVAFVYAVKMCILINDLPFIPWIDVTAQKQPTGVITKRIKSIVASLLGE